MLARTLALALPLPLLMLSVRDAHAQRVARVVDSLMAPYAASGMPGAAVLVVHDGRVVIEKGYGLAEVETHRRVDARTDFRLASLTKQFTATAIMLLVADHRLRYDDAIGPLLPELPSWAKGVTVRQLLNHTGGLPDYEDFVPDSQTRQVHDAEIPALISHATGPTFAPGTRYAYSNTGYVLLALVVERASGRRFADFLHDRIFAPLGMTGTVAYEAGRAMPTGARRVMDHDRAYGYTVSSSGVARTDQSNTSATLGDGGVYTSVHDLAKWDRALERHTLVSADAQRLAWTPPTLPHDSATQYGFGWFVDQDHGTMRLTHHGESRGFTNAILRYPERRITVIVLTNRTTAVARDPSKPAGAGSEPWDIAQRIADLYLAP